jgi:protoheme IX farnesyltransferase
MTNYTTKVEKLNTLSIVKQKISDYGVLMKFRLSLTVVFSAAMAYLIAQDEPTNWIKLAVLVFGGFFVTGAASALNQVLEKDYDRMMKRTEKRPVAAGRMTTSEAVLVAGLLSLVGVSLLCLFNAMTAFLGMVSLILYAFVYTPLKRVSNIAVIVGAFPGAFPMLIGCTAAQGGALTWLGLTLFAIQFLWQLPHFWAIAWLAHEDYERAGFQLLPTNQNERNNQVGMQAMLYALFLLPLSWLPFGLGVTGLGSAIFLTAAALAFAWFGWQLHKKCDRISARKLMFASLLYLPAVLSALLIDKI